MRRPQRWHDVRTNIDWYGRRLSRMTPAEILWRCTRATAELAPRRELSAASDDRLLGTAAPDWDRMLQRFRDCDDRPLLLDRARATAIAARCPSHASALVAAAERVLDGRVTYFGYPEAHLGTPIDWNYDPVAGVRWPLTAARSIDHRVAPADPKWIWELNRLQHLPWLAQAWLFTGREVFAEVALEHLDSWTDQNPVGRGIAWRGAFESGIRSLSVVTALQGLRDHPALTAARFESYVRTLASSADHCWRDRSRFSSANNHLVGELAGLAAVSILLPELRQARRWKGRALQALGAEASRQILPDGSGAEQAVGYQVFTVELLLVVAALLRSHGDDLPQAITGAIERSGEYLAVLVGESDPAPRYGDDDEGFALRLGPEPVRSVRDHLGIVAGFTGNRLVSRAGQETLTALWIEAMTGQAAPSDVGDTSEALAGGLIASEGGMVVLRSNGRRIMMDIGPLGYRSLAAHGHADALSVTLSVDGHELIGDPGTASYYGHPEWRKVHRGTRVHPTVTVDGEDQSVMGGPFMWTRHARVRSRCLDLPHGIVDAEHDGYRRLADPVTHRRWLHAPPGDQTVLVVDVLLGKGEHEMRASWPLHPDLDVAVTPAGHLASRGGSPALLIAYGSSTDLEMGVVRGDPDSHLGWWADRLERRTPSWLVWGACRGRAPLVIASLITLGTDGAMQPITSVKVDLVSNTIVTTWYEGPRRRRVTIDRSLSGAVRETDSTPAP